MMCSGVEVYFEVFLTLGTNVVDDSALLAEPLEKGPQQPLDRRPRGSQGLSRHMQKQY
jgi:hypothetical protein